MIPVEYFLIRKRLLEELLSKMPRVTEGLHDGRHVYRYYKKGDNHYQEIGSGSKYWESAVKNCNIRKDIKAKLNSIKRILRNNYRNSNKSAAYSVINTDYHMNCNFYDSLDDCSCDYENKTKYYYNGRHYRSRAEMDIAVILDEFGLEFKYDVKIKIGGVLFTVDFVICFREFNRCVFLEYFGKCNDPDYVEKRIITKIRYNSSNDIYLSRDLFALSGNDIYTPSIPVIRSYISSLIEMICLYHIRSEGSDFTSQQITQLL